MMEQGSAGHQLCCAIHSPSINAALQGPPVRHSPRVWKTGPCRPAPCVSLRSAAAQAAAGSTAQHLSKGWLAKG